MARVSRSALTKLEIIRVASRKFLEEGYTDTTVKAICNELDMSTGNLTFYYPTKEHLLASLVKVLCEFQRNLIGRESNEGYSSILSVCLEVGTMAAVCENDAVARDFFLSAYQSALSLDIIRKNDAIRAKEVYKDYCSDWTEEQFAEAQILISGVEYSTMMASQSEVPLRSRIATAINAILTVYGVPEEIRQQKIEKVLSLDCQKLGRNILVDFKKYVNTVNEEALIDLVKN